MFSFELMTRSSNKLQRKNMLPEGATEEDGQGAGKKGEKTYHVVGDAAMAL